jgi:hypothetical protein
MLGIILTADDQVLNFGTNVLSHSINSNLYIFITNCKWAYAQWQLHKNQQYTD